MKFVAEEADLKNYYNIAATAAANSTTSTVEMIISCIHYRY